MITLKSEQQLSKMRDAGILLSSVLGALRGAIAPGITTKELDRMAERMIVDAGARPSFKGYNGFPASICASPDAVVVHGIPDDTPLKDGQILSIDCGVILHGWQSDAAFTVPIGAIPPEARALIDVTEQCFYKALEQVREGNRIGDISHAVQVHAEAHGYGVIRDLCGHGIGEMMHEDPSIPNFGTEGRGVRLKAGMTLAIEPMICLGHWPVFVREDGWTVVTRDLSLCAHYEHTVAVTHGAPEILSRPAGEGDGI